MMLSPENEKLNNSRVKFHHQKKEEEVINCINLNDKDSITNTETTLEREIEKLRSY